MERLNGMQRMKITRTYGDGRPDPEPEIISTEMALRDKASDETRLICDLLLRSPSGKVVIVKSPIGGTTTYELLPYRSPKL